MDPPSYKAKLCQLPKHLKQPAHNFKASNGLLNNGKRDNVKSYTTCGESGNADIVKTEEWKALLAILFDGY